MDVALKVRGREPRLWACGLECCLLLMTHRTVWLVLLEELHCTLWKAAQHRRWW